MSTILTWFWQPLPKTAFHCSCPPPLPKNIAGLLWWPGKKIVLNLIDNSDQFSSLFLQTFFPKFQKVSVICTSPFFGKITYHQTTSHTSTFYLEHHLLNSTIVFSYNMYLKEPSSMNSITKWWMFNLAHTGFLHSYWRQKFQDYGIN